MSGATQEVSCVVEKSSHFSNIQGMKTYHEDKCLDTGQVWPSYQVVVQLERRS